MLRTFLVKYPALLTEDAGRRMEDRELMWGKGDMRKEDGELSMEDSRLRVDLRI